MPIDPQEDPPIKPGRPSEPPQENPPGNPRPEVPPPMRDPGEPPRPEELPGHTPDELPVRGPEAPPTPATDAGLDVPDSGPADVATRRCGELGATRYAAGVMQKYGLKRWPECAMNNAASGLYIFRNKNKLAFDTRHNPA